jgi:hypothetical protein
MTDRVQGELFNLDEFTYAEDSTSWGWFDGGQNKNSLGQIAPHDGGQTVESGLEAAPHDGGQNKNSLFDRSEGDTGTWIEIEHRKGGNYKYLRWRECSGKKRSKYLGKVSI